MWVDKKSQQPTKIDFMDAGGKKLKTTECARLSRTTTPTTTDPAQVVVTDHRRNDHKTRDRLHRESSSNQGLKDDFFTQRSLVRGH